MLLFGLLWHILCNVSLEPSLMDHQADIKHAVTF